jgi:hypothetical protein
LVLALSGCFECTQHQSQGESPTVNREGGVTFFL